MKLRFLMIGALLTFHSAPLSETKEIHFQFNTPEGPVKKVMRKLRAPKLRLTEDWISPETGPGSEIQSTFNFAPEIGTGSDSEVESESVADQIEILDRTPASLIPAFSDRDAGTIAEILKEDLQVHFKK